MSQTPPKPTSRPTLLTIPLILSFIIIIFAILTLTTTTTTATTISQQINALAVQIKTKNNFTTTLFPQLPLTSTIKTFAVEEEAPAEEMPVEEGPPKHVLENAEEEEEEEAAEEEPEEPKNPLVVVILIAAIFLILIVILVIAVVTEIHTWCCAWLTRRRAERAPQSESERFEAQLAATVHWEKLPPGERHDHII
jgi:flagellar basal body-associated protein FliL